MEHQIVLESLDSGKETWTCSIVCRHHFAEPSWRITWLTRKWNQEVLGWWYILIVLPNDRNTMNAALKSDINKNPGYFWKWIHSFFKPEPIYDSQTRKMFDIWYDICDDNHAWEIHFIVQVFPLRKGLWTFGVGAQTDFSGPALRRLHDPKKCPQMFWKQTLSECGG